MARFGAKKERKIPQGVIWTVVIAAILIGIFIYSSRSLNEANAANEYQLLETSVERSITQCYALEGRYPESLSYLKEHYGLTYDEEQYTIVYNFIGSNLRPDITIIQK